MDVFRDLRVSHKQTPTNNHISMLHTTQTLHKRVLQVSHNTELKETRSLYKISITYKHIYRDKWFQVK